MLIKYVEIPIYGKIAKMDSVLSPYDRSPMTINTVDGEFVVCWKTENGDYYCTDNKVEQTQRKSHYSDIWEYKNKYFRYNYTDALVSIMTKATPEELEEEEQWKKEHNGKGLMNYTSDGYYIWESVGLGRENWDDIESRKEYLSMWIGEINEECEYLVEEFIKEMKI